MTLEARYRRLLRLYPHRHRAVYGEEMIGVLLATAGPGRDRPSLADRFDIARSALTLRLWGAGRPGGAGRWEAASAVVVFGALLLAANGAVRLAAWGVWVAWQEFPVFPAAAPMAASPVIWALVVAAALAGRRRAAAALAAAGLVVETARAATRWTELSDAMERSAWLIALAAVVVAAAGLLCTGAPAGRPRALGVAFAAAGVLFVQGFLGQAGGLTIEPLDLPLFLTMVALAVWCWWRQPALVRAWLPVWGVPVAAALLV